MTKRAEFQKYVDDYKAFTGLKFDENNPEQLSLFFQYLQARNIFEVRNNIIEQNKGLSELIKAIETKL